MTVLLGLGCAVLLVACVALGWALAFVRRQLALARMHIDTLERDLDAALRPGPPTSSAERAVRRVIRTATRVREQGIAGLIQSTIEDITTWAGTERADILNMAAADGTVTLFFSDVEDSTALNDQLGDKTFVKVLAAHDRIVRTRIEQHQGQVVKTAGDGFMVAFRDTEAACRAAIAIQRDLGRPSDSILRRHPIQVRIGIHTGQVVARDGDYFGTNVAMAARVASVAAGGEIFVSEAVTEALADSSITPVPVGVYELKGLSGEHPISQLLAGETR
ncbi:MAG TPA: adenylate/guanylate cyclase domain-containing protein [Nocardioides sp.]|nr:adenylate/guanylate cyclase domain-containing protein [Nocardioides sp.]